MDPNYVQQRAKRNGLLVVGLVSVACLSFVYPFYKREMLNRQNLTLSTTERPLGRNEAMRGPYVNSGSRDIGPDLDHPMNRKVREKLEAEEAARSVPAKPPAPSDRL